MSNEVNQGLYIVGTFDSIYQKDRKDKDGITYKTHHISVLLRGSGDGGTRVLSIRTKHPERYTQLKRDDPVRIPVTVGSFKDFVYYTDAS